MKKIGLTVVSFWAVLSVWAADASPEWIVLAKQQKTSCAIYVNPDVMVAKNKDIGKLVNPAREDELQRQLLRASVKDLAHYLKEISGADVPIRTDAVPENGTIPIIIGDLAEKVFGAPSVKADFKQGLCVVADTRKGIGLYGESALASSYAIYTFLDQLGCRWFFPTKMGEVIPKSDELRFPVQNLAEAPYTVFRGGSGYGFDEDFSRRNRMGGMLPPTQHCLESGYISKEEKAKHPEWIAQYKDLRPMPNRLKWSQQAVSNRIGEIIVERQHLKPVPFYCLSPDDGARFDETEADAVLDAGDFDPTFQTTSLTDRAVAFYNRIVERSVKDFPDLRFSALAYVQYTRPPIREKPHKNLVIQIAPITYARAHPMSMSDVPDNDGLCNIVEGWGRVSTATSYYFYGYFLAEPICLFPCLRKWAFDLPYIYQKGACRYWQPETFGNYEFFAMAQWMGLRMAWNPKQDPWKLYREVNNSLYGAAANEMWAFWDAVDRIWVDTPEYSGCGFGHLYRFTPERLKETRSLMDKAVAAAKTDIEKQRIGLVKTSLDLTEGFVELRRDLAEGRWVGLDQRSKDWKQKVSDAAKATLEQRCFAHCWWAKSKSFAEQYFDWFYANTNSSAENLATSKHLLLKQPVRAFRFKVDKEQAGLKTGFANQGFDDSQWQETDASYRTWSSMGCHNLMGSMWYRTILDVSSVPSGKKIWLWLGATDGTARVYVNGKQVLGGREPAKLGEIIKLSDEPGGFCVPLVFDITDAVKVGSNTLSILATRTTVNEVGTGGLLAPVTIFCDK